ncbi:unnamed protein product [Bursaphelenchus xylophilus]|uniref:(pine wood nematode) hypothetical protein n=1 Tax=Bursaphelenchus xylophilus TaxID=6326 RepID=A0A1I7RL22_BURXY|nr:unnamed protein product [Bursaphelenchus xylophilus]CAG9083560.1 unnamed protein product [Bursaphelenchus xylophilus]
MAPERRKRDATISKKHFSDSLFTKDLEGERGRQTPNPMETEGGAATRCKTRRLREIRQLKKVDAHLTSGCPPGKVPME